MRTQNLLAWQERLIACQNPLLPDLGNLSWHHLQFQLYAAPCHASVWWRTQLVLPWTDVPELWEITSYAGWRTDRIVRRAHCADGAALARSTIGTE
jgi:hypothetical protein